MKAVNAISTLIIGATLATRAFALDVDPQLPPYRAAPTETGDIKSVGSDTLAI